MVAILRPVWLAIPFFAVQVRSFVPFGEVHIPHVQVRKAISGLAGAPAAQQQRQSSLPLMMSPVTQVAPERQAASETRLINPLAWLYYDKQLAKNPMPLRIPFSATRIVDDWMGDAQDEMESFTIGERTSIVKATVRMQALANYQSSLERFATFIHTRNFERVLALTAKWYGGKNVIQGLAVVTSLVLRDDSGRLAALAQYQGLRPRGGAEFETVNIAMQIRALEDQQDGVREEFIRRIVTWAWVTGRMVTIPVAGDEMERRYRDLGFERVESNGAYMVYTGYGLGSLGNAERFQMFTFEV